LPGVLLRAGGCEIHCAALLVAAGRKPQKLEMLGLERAAVRYTKDGHSVAPDTRPGKHTKNLWENHHAING